MSTKTWQKIFSVLLLAGMLISLARPGTGLAQAAGKPSAAPAAIQEDPLAKIEQQVLDELKAGGSTDFFINMKAAADLTAADSLSTKEQKGTFVFKTLLDTANSTQKDLRAYLDQQGVAYSAYYIVNAILVKGGSQALLMNIASRPDVASITANHQYQLDEPIIEDVGPQAPTTIEPNIIFVKAPDVWAMGINGSGVLLAGNDTGLQWDHPAIIDHYRGWNGTTADHNYNWWDATGTYPMVPTDGHGHGTHTTGTMVGDDGGTNQIGMAPGAQTIHCKNMTDGGSGSDSTFLTCFQWDLAPWDLSHNNPRPDLAPDAINNSWGYSGGNQNQFRTAIDNLQAAGILVEVSAGNEGPACATLRSPGDYQEVLTTGSVNHAGGVLPGTLTGFSSRGPSDLDGNYFPDVMAPGENIRSSVPGSAYQGGWSGTSMAGPHTVGLVGLIWSANPALRGQVDQTMQIIKDTAIPLTGQNGSNCGGDYTTGPNNDWGVGTIDALAAVQLAISFGGVGTLDGTVTDSVTSNPIAGVDIVASLNPTQTFPTVTDGNGFYSMAVYSGTYTVDASIFGYLPGQMTGVSVMDGMTTTVDFALTMAPSYVVSATVIDANTGWPLYANISLGGTPWPAIWNDPVTGHFEVAMPMGITYTLGVDAWVGGYLHQDVVIPPLTGDVSIVIALDADEIACNAPGYGTVGGFFENFDSTTPPTLPGGWATIIVNDPGTDPVWAARAGTRYPSGYPAHSTPNLVFFNSFSAPNNAEARLYTQSGIDMTSLPSYNLDFWMFRDTGYSANNDYVQVQVSTNGGGTWTNVGPQFSRYLAGSNYWEMKTVDMSAYASETNLMLGFLGHSAYGNDIHLDDITLGGIPACLSPSGGLVVGNVYSENQGTPINGAHVSNEAGEMAVAVATPNDPLVDDAFFSIYSPAGTQTFTATFGTYGPDVQSLGIMGGETLGADFYLPSPSAATDPTSLTTSVELGSVVTETLTIINDGGYPLDFEFKEKPGDFFPLGGPTAGEDVLVVAHDTSAAAAMEAGLTALGYTYLQVTDAQFQAMTVDDLLTYSAVFHAGVTGLSGAPSASEVLLMAYLDAGGSLYISDNDLGYYRHGSVFYDTYLQSTYGVDNGGDLVTGDGIMAGLNPDITPDPYPDDFTIGPQGVQIFHFTVSGNSAGVFVNRNGYLAIYTSWDFQNIVAPADEVELVSRVMSTIGLRDVTWLSENPITGTVPSMSSLPVDVVFNASVPDVTSPGTYTADLVLKSNDPINGRLTVPVEMNVTAPASWGELQGTVETMGYCDGNPAPIEGATVMIESSDGYSATTMTDASGFYHFWVDSVHNPITMTVTAADQSDGSAVVDIVPQGVVTQDFSLMWQKPCVSASPDTLESDVTLGMSVTVQLTLQNTGHLTSTFAISEQDGGYVPSQVKASEDVNAAAKTRTWAAPELAETGIASDKIDIGPASGGPAPEDIGDAWETMAPMPAGRVFNAVVADANGYVYVLGGTSDAGGAIPTNTNYRYDTAANVWDTMAPIPTTMSQIDGIAIDNKIYIPGDSGTDTTYVYDIASNTWSSIASNGGYSARAQYQVAAIGSDLYVLGGIAGSTSTTEVWILDTTSGTWSAGVPMQKSRTSFSAGAIGGNIYVAGGVYYPGFTPDMTAEMFDGSTWTYIANVPNGGGAYTRWSYNADGIGLDGLWLGAGRRDAGWAVLNHAGYYNPDSDTWTDSPTIPMLNQGRVYMEGDVATDGYFYVIGGRDSAGAIIYADNERLMVGSPVSTDVPWLSEDPVAGVLNPETGEVTVDVTMDASVVSQPGVYYAFLKVKTDDPMHGMMSVPVTMTVTPTPDYGILMGTVTSLGYCDTNPSPIEGAEVLIEASDGMTYAVTTDANGEYSQWLSVAGNDYIVSVTAPDHEFGIVAGVVITGQETTVVDFDLRLNLPCVSVAPEMLEVTVPLGYEQTVPLNIVNNGAVSANFEISETDEQMPGSAADELIQDGSFEAGTPSPFWTEYSTNFGTPICDVAGCGTGGGTAGPLTGNFWAWFGGITAYEEGWVSQDVVIPEGQASLSFNIWVGTTGSPAEDYFDVRIDGDVLFHVTGADNPTYPAYTLVTLDISQYADGGTHTVEFYSECMGGGTTNFSLDDISLMTSPGEPPVDIPWLSESPITGTVDHDSSFPVDVTFTAFPTMTVGGVYTAALQIASDDPMIGLIEVPVMMTVINPVYGMIVSADQEGDCPPGLAITYTVTVTNTSNFSTDSFTITVGTANYTTTVSTDMLGPLGMGESATFQVVVNVPPDAQDGDHDTAEIMVTSVGDPTEMAMTHITTNVFVIIPPQTMYYIYLPVTTRIP